MNARHWLFDFDGTLIDSAPAILGAFAAALHETGLEPQVPLNASLIGPPLAETLGRISGSRDAALIQLLSNRFKSHYDHEGVLNTPAYPGIEPMLESLAEAGIELHIATNKRLAATRAILDHLGWTTRFVSVYALDMIEPRLPTKQALLKKQLADLKLERHQARYIGDKHEDGLAAAANGLAFHYAGWGYGDLSPATLPPEWTWLEQPQDLLIALASKEARHA